MTPTYRKILRFILILACLYMAFLLLQQYFSHPQLNYLPQPAAGSEVPRRDEQPVLKSCLWCLLYEEACLLLKA